MEDQNNTNLSQLPSLTDEQMAERRRVVTTFWDTYEDSGASMASSYFEKEVDGQPAVARMLLPDILLEARGRGIDTIKFLMDMDKFLENSNANRATDDGRGVHTLSDNEAVVDEDKDAPETARDADGEADKPAESGIEST